MVKGTSKTNQKIADFGIFAIVSLWVYAAISKLRNFPQFKVQMHSQALPKFIQEGLIYFLPTTELIVAFLLICTQSVLLGLRLSIALLSIFTIYILLVIVKIIKNAPCSCGGILEKMNWNVHFIFNIAFIALTVFTLIVIKRKEHR